jgi:hypothetical protein
MRLICLLLLLCSKTFAQTFGKSAVQVNPLPPNEQEMLFYKWYVHPKEENIFIINFETTIDGFMIAFNEVNKLLEENNLEFKKPISDMSSFDSSFNSEHSVEELHHSIKKERSKIFRTWNAEKDYLTLMLKHDVYMLILGNKKIQ